MAIANPVYAVDSKSPRKLQKTLWDRIVQHRTLYLLFLPIVVYYIVFRYWPIALTWIVAFKELQLGNGVFASPWVGLDNFRIMFTDPVIPTVIKNTVEISLLRIVIGFTPPIILAIIFHDLASRRFKRVMQTLVYIPHFFSWVIVFGIVFGFFSVGSGFINNMLELFGFSRHEFLLDEDWFRPILIGSAIWKEVGWATIIYLAALATVDPMLYEAAVVDGAGPLKRLWHITVPGIMPVVSFVLCLNLGNILNAGGEQILLFYNQAVLDKADVIETWVYREGLGSMQLSLGTAMGLFQSFIGLITVLISNALAKRYTGRGIW